MLARRREYLYLGGLLSSGVSILFWLHFASSIFGGFVALFQFEVKLPFQNSRSLLFRPSIQVSTSMDCKHRHLADDVFDSCISRASEFVEKLMAEVGSNSIRGPGLANLEIERRKLIFGKGNAENIMEDLILYFSRFGHLACFTADGEVFLQVLPGDRKKLLLDKLVKNIASSST